MTEERKYIYAIVRNPKETEVLDIFSLSEAVYGINNRDIIFIPYRDIAAVVSNTHRINFDKFDKKELTQLVAIHEQVNSRLLEKHDVIPMRFGMVAESMEEIRSILAKAYIQFKAVLERIVGKAEFVVQAFWNEKNTLVKIVRENTEIQKLKNEAESKGRIWGFSSKMKLGKRIFEAIESRRKEYTADILKELAASFPDFCAGKLLDANEENVSNGVNPVRNRTQTQAPAISNGVKKEMIMNHSFLVGKTEEPTLEFQLNKLAEKYKELKFKYIGPMAPYSFAVIKLGVGNFDLVDNARKTLGLGELATFLEIRDAYHKLAAERHPDKYEYKRDQVILEKAEGKMKDIITAHEILTIYCKHYLSALAPEKKQICSFKKEDVEESIIVKES